MNDKQKTPADDDQTPTNEQTTIERPTPEEPAAESPANRTRNTLIAGGAGLALAGGLIGFGIGHASADGGDGDRFRPVGQYAPGEGRGFRDGDRPGKPLGGDRGRHFRNGDSEEQPSEERPSSES